MDDSAVKSRSFSPGGGGKSPHCLKFHLWITIILYQVLSSPAILTSSPRNSEIIGIQMFSLEIHLSDWKRQHENLGCWRLGATVKLEKGSPRSLKQTECQGRVEESKTHEKVSWVARVTDSCFLFPLQNQNQKHRFSHIWIHNDCSRHCCLPIKQAILPFILGNFFLDFMWFRWGWPHPQAISII